MGNIKNISTEMPQNLSDLISIKENQVVSMSLSTSEAVQMMLLSFAEGEGVSEEAYFGDALYYMVEGEARVEMDKKEVILRAGEVFKVSEQTLHAIYGNGAFKILQIILNN